MYSFMDLSGLQSHYLSGRSSDLRIVLRLHLPVVTLLKGKNSGVLQPLSPLTALAQRYGFTPYSLFIT